MLTNPLLTKLNRITDADGDSYATVERTTDSDEFDIVLNGTDVFNADEIESFFQNRVGFGGITSTQFPRDGATISSYVLAKKPDEPNANAAGYIMWSNDTLRTTDFSMLKAGGTEASPAALTTSDWISNMRFEGMDTDLEFQTAASIRVEVYDTVSSGIVTGELNQLVANSAGTLINGLSLNYDRIDFYQGEVRMTSLGDLAINRNQNDAGLRVFTQNDNNAIRVRSNGISTGVDSVGIFVGAPNSSFGVAGSQAGSVTTVNAATATLGTSDHFVRVDYTTTGAVTITLPSAASAWQAGASVGREYIIKDTGCNAAVNNITINRAGTDTIITDITTDTSVVINGNGDAVRLKVVASNQWALY